MAKVGKLKLCIGSKYPQEYPLFYTQAKKFEVRGVTPDLFNITGAQSFGYDTENHIREAMYVAAEKYHQLKTKQRLVIGYSCKASSTLRMTEVHRGHYHGTAAGVSRKIKDFNSFKTPYCTVGIEYNVYMEVFNGKENQYFTVNAELEQENNFPVGHDIKEGITVIPYTDQSLAFFDRLRDSMRDMVKKLSFFFDMPSQEAQNLISEETNLLK